MKKNIILRTLSAVLVCMLTCALVLTGCSDAPKPEGAPAGTSDGQNTVNTAQALPPDGSGVRAEHITSAGFDMGVDTLESFSKKFGAPASAETKEYNAETVTTAVYDFGVVEFDGPKDGQQVLTYIAVDGELAGPCLLVPGDDLYLTADAIYTGSAKQIRELGDESYIFLYGDSESAANGQYMMLETEFVTSEMVDESCLVYVVPLGGGRARYTIYADADKKLTRYELSYGK